MFSTRYRTWWCSNESLAVRRLHENRPGWLYWACRVSTVVHLALGSCAAAHVRFDTYIYTPEFIYIDGRTAEEGLGEKRGYVFAVGLHLG